MQIIFKYLLILLTFSPFITFAQYEISGKIVNNANEPISYSNISLNATIDSIFVKGTITEENGTFLIDQINAGEYYLKVSFVGYQTKIIPVIIDSDEQINPIQLEEEIAQLSDIKIYSKRPRIIKEVDRIIFDVENTSLSSGNSWDILNKTPGVININGDLKIRNTSATVYINDKKVYLTSSELKQFLDGLSAENIKQIEVIRNPPAKYDAGNGPILNIVTTKNHTPGYKASLNGNYTQAIFPKYTLGTSHFYKNEKLNLFANYSFTKAKHFKEDESYINFLNNKEVFQHWDTNFNKTTQEQQHNFNLVLDYQFDEKNKISLNGTSSLTPKKDLDNSGRTRIFDNNKVLDSSFTTNSQLQNDLFNAAVDLTFSHNFEKENTQLSFNAHATYFEQNNDQQLFTRYFNKENLLLTENSFSSEGYQKINIYAGQADFETVFGTYKFLAGAKYAFVNSTSSLFFFDVQTLAETFHDNILTDKFTYNEAISAVYTSVSKDWNKWKAKAGLRVENTYREGNSVALNQETNRNYTNFFPSLFISYQAAENHNFSFDYGRKIARPSYTSLNPFRYYINENSYQSGNPNLNAALSNSFNLNYTYKDAYSFDFYFRDNGENVAQLVFQNNENQFLRSVQANMLESKSYGIDFLHGRSLKNWWYAQVVFSGFHEEETFVALESNNAEVTNDINGFYLSLYNGLTLSKEIGRASCRERVYAPV